ncbi:dipeptide ABC transporter ATP-binding protein [Sphingomonas elodea]|uniref:dipeptide ABC transporter ATP-binding protein n=1 Tax=Sphingomonas elodea TaxID=179878 RepID=UPI0002630D15|nr:ABC transporter ATP-binding protein [Sphingomonas elodea]
MVIPFPAPQPPLIEADGLRIGFGDAPPVVRDIRFSLARGECLALVGESGSGKSVTARTLVGLAGRNARVTANKLTLFGEDALGHDEARWRSVRGARIGFVLQDALGSLDPLRSVGDEIGEALRLHTRLNRAARVIELLGLVGIPDPERRARQRPRELSGGLRQRALIASAMACGPDVLIADEPTTALDAAIQGEILDLLASLKAAGTALLLISHDLGVVANLADRIAVMRDGVIVEQGAARTILDRPAHGYTQRLVAAARAIHGAAKAVPSVPHRGEQSAGRPLLVGQQLSKAYPAWRGGKPLSAVAGVSVQVMPGETLGIVGESGCGKTTLARMLLGLERPDSGEIWFDGRPRDRLTPKERRRVQVIFQDPLASFDPRYTVFRVLDEALSLHGRSPLAERRRRATALMEQVRLDPALIDRRPIELSGGQRQRLAIARAIAPEPALIVCDEPVSALDVSIQADILALLADLKGRLGLASVFISHDLGIVRAISDRVAVMQSGVIVEEGPVERVFAAPAHPYTARLLAAIPALDPEKARHRA